MLFYNVTQSPGEVLVYGQTCRRKDCAATHIFSPQQPWGLPGHRTSQEHSLCAESEMTRPDHFDIFFSIQNIKLFSKVTFVKPPQPQPTTAICRLRICEWERLDLERVRAGIAAPAFVPAL